MAESTAFVFEQIIVVSSTNNEQTIVPVIHKEK